MFACGILAAGWWHRWALCFVAAHACACMLLLFGMSDSGTGRVDCGAWRGAAAFSFPLYLNQLLTFFYQRFDTVLVTGLLGIESAAIYEMIKRLPPLARALSRRVARAVSAQRVVLCRPRAGTTRPRNCSERRCP